jgi:D-3-phosphoglycerate dehydrogenase / 2-oxoglutarate reductase
MMMSDKFVLVTDYTWPSTEPEAQVLASVDARLLIAKTGSEEELLALVPQADAILTCFARVPSSVIRAGKKLQVVGRYGIGVDNIDVDEATRLGIPVTNVPAYCLDEVAEHALALLFSCARKVTHYHVDVQRGNWSLQGGMPMYRIRGRTLGILGFGKIGQTLASKSQSLGMNLIAYDPYMSAEAVQQHGVTLVSLEEIFAQSDFLSIHTPLTPDTEQLINRDNLRLMKPTSYVINTSRGAVIDQEALLEALLEEWIAGAALDVFVPERPSADHPLLAHPNLIATPHVAFYSEESVVELEIKAAENVAAILSGQKPAAVVNPQVLDLPRWAHLK